MNKQQGFTLVELVVVIIILGILAVTAAPKFINMQSDARVSTLQGVKGAINGANVMVYAKASLDGQVKANTNGSGTITLDSKDATGKNITVSTMYGYVKADPADITNVADLAGSDWDVYAANKVPTEPKGMPTPAVNAVVIHQKNAPATCYIEYTQASSTALPSFVTTHAVAKGC